MRGDTRREHADRMVQFRDDSSRLQKLLFEEDPIGICDESNHDEYSPEVQAILARVGGCVTVDEVSAVVHEEFCQMFDADAGARARYQRIAERIFGELPHLFPKRAG